MFMEWLLGRVYHVIEYDEINFFSIDWWIRRHNVIILSVSHQFDHSGRNKMNIDEKRALKVFLCHASGDKPRVRDLYKRLIHEGIDTWLDQEKLIPGQDWGIEIPRAVKEADVVVVCLSNNSITKEGYIQTEIKFALDVAEEKPDGTIFLIPARIEDCPVPEKLSRWQWVDLFEENGYARLLASLQLRAAKVGASTFTDEDDETERRLDQYYTEGLAAFYTEDWNKACQKFRLILNERPNHKNALEKLEEAERRRDMADLYSQAADAIKVENWETAIQALSDLLKRYPEYKDAAQLLKNALKQKQLGDLYFEARKLHQAEKWQAVVKVFDQIHALEPNHPDPDRLLPHAQKEADEIKRLAELNHAYSLALREMDLGHWQESRQLLEKIHKSQTGYLETERLLQKVEDELKKQEDQTQRINQINTLYEQAHGLVRAKSWQKAQEKIREIRRLDGEFEDKDMLLEKVNAALAQEDQEAQKQNQLAEKYANAIRLLKEEKFLEALTEWEEIHTLDPKYPDRQWVQRTAQRKLKELGKLTKKTSTWERYALWILTALLVVFLTTAGIILSNGTKITTLQIPSEKNTGLQYQVPVSGYYTFRYKDSAFSAYALDASTSPTLEAWSTTTVCFKGTEPLWGGKDLNFTAALFAFNSDSYVTKELAVAAAEGKNKKVYLKRGDWVTCVVGDGKYTYGDNSGEIILEVYYSLK